MPNPGHIVIIQNPENPLFFKKKRRVEALNPENPLLKKKKRRVEALNPEHPSGGGSESYPEHPLGEALSPIK